MPGCRFSPLLTLGPVISRIDLRGSSTDPRDVLPRAEFDVEAALEKVRPIAEDVSHRGVAALIEITERFDGVRLESTRVPAEQIAEALEQLDPEVRAALEESIRRARAVHSDQRRVGHTTQVVPGGTVTQRWVPVDRVGLYVPGGLAVYPSSVVMNVVPAQEAGVPGIAVSSPPQKAFGGRVHPAILAACALLGVDEVYAVGGAQAVAMFALGTEECAPVNLVTGPGNIYVAAAKRLFAGRIGIDSEAGPTEIMVLADDTADAAEVAADLISQAEHGPTSGSVLVTASPLLADAVEAELKTQVARTKHSERVAEALGGPQSGIILVDDLEQGLAVVNAYAAEHLEIQTAEPHAVSERVRNAGAIFLGRYTPVSLGDYAAGSNHVLPTGGCACHSSGLSVQTFLRGVQVVEYDREALAGIAAHVVNLSAAEDLPGHGDAVKARFDWTVPGA
ncbi:histidinol dehydrogenase [Kitasatospora cineracea]|uniref:Histidinol dehydrogenase n=1 Tax=Kitasatospora cineracea TaxID=88074 RepID=A0A8G1UJ08_9ACTN|nr:histidinol dehydrogenase [Kitasatospora cineracea]